jgi:adenylate cyclase
MMAASSGKTMKSSYRGYLLCVLYFVGAACLWVLIRFVGLSSVPAFATLDVDALDHGALFGRAVAVGCVIGTIFYVVSRALDTPAVRQRPYGMLIIMHALSNIVCVTLVLILLTVIEIIVADTAFTWSVFQSRLVSVNFVVTLVYYTLLSFSFVIIKEIDRKFGPGNLRKLVSGTFYHPREIEIIVMFLDLKDSTTYAERLGHLKFGSLIQDCFIDMSVVTNFEAQFYQYVGDESILLWDVADGIENGNCLQAYFAFSHRLAERRDYYQSRYGLVPEFKAGVNIGLATVLEVGDIKREISYLGDVLNTAARIQDQCNVHGERLLISETLHNRLPSVPAHLDINAIGMTELRGRAKAVRLYRVREQPTEDPLR